ncbi:sugar transferase [Corticibacterium sp. UT-5YL-CI-8]|nr:sugar transferase [Tianweitania sp. UT-5YL-CI-8]
MTEKRSAESDALAVGARSYDRWKRVIDVAACLVGGLVVLPILGIASLAVKLNSPGPVVFAQVRVGRDGRLFKCRKLRSMHVGTPSRPTHEVGVASITTVGRYLRGSKIDELPQLWNVLKGEMSLVGPRPCLPEQDLLVHLRREQGALSVRPGITGLAQVQNVDMSDPERLAAIDAQYVRDRSFGLDLRILWKTLPF